MYPSADKGRRWILASREEIRDAAVTVADAAQRSLVILTPDLEPGIYDNEAFLDIVKRLVLSKRYAKIRMIITEPARAIPNGNRFVGVARRLNTSIELRNAHEDFRGHREAFLIADDNALLYRVDCSRWEGLAAIADRVVTRRYLDLFEEIWNLSEPTGEFREIHT